MNFNSGQNGENIVCIYYFPESKSTSTNIWLKYCKIENIAQQKQYFKNDNDINTILRGGLWYKIYVQKSFLQTGVVLEKVERIVEECDNKITNDKKEEVIMCVRHNEHKTDVLFHNYSNFSTETMNNLAFDEYILVETIKKSI